MNSFEAVTTLVALLFLFPHGNQPAQIPIEKQAIENIQRIPASRLDDELPSLPFNEWFGNTVKQPDNGIIWQLSECGEQSSATPNETRDPRACVEINTILADGRRVIVLIAVGTFKKGMTGAPNFQFGVIDKSGELRRIRRLSHLQSLLLNKEPVIKLPDIKSNSIAATQGLTSLDYYRWPLVGNGEDVIQFMMTIEEKSQEPPTPPSAREGLRQGSPIVRVQPTYPRNNNARRFKASGQVEVQVTISITGRVISAKAISGHPLLRESAVQAALQWEFEPTTINGVPTETQVTLTFNFAAPPQ